MSATTAPQLPHQSLSPREFEVFVWLAQGERCCEIAQKTGLSIKTISTYRTRALKKLGMTNNHAITLYCVRNGLVE